MIRPFAALAAWLALCAACCAQSDPKIALDPASASTAGGVSSADVLVAGPSIFTPANSLGLTAGSDFLNDVSYGQDVLAGPLFFAVDRTAVGLPGTGVDAEATVNNVAPNIYASSLAGTNAEAVSGASLGLVPGLFGDGLTAIAAGAPNPFTYFALNANSAVLGGVGGENIYASNGGGTFSVFANGSLLGITATDQVDGLTVFDADGDGVADPGVDFALFSLSTFSSGAFTTSGAAYAPGVLGALSPSDVLFTDFTGSFTLYASAGQLGLRADDELTALQLRAVPEPAGLSLLAAGLSLVALRTRRLSK